MDLHENGSTTGENLDQGAVSAMSNITTSPDLVQVAIGITEDNTAAIIVLNVKTLDHRVFQVRLLASSSVPHLKSKIEAETGVVSDRQRLIFRGKVLKNENTLAFYSLENGHTLHLVVRPADIPTGQTTSISTISNPAPVASNTRTQNPLAGIIMPSEATIPVAPAPLPPTAEQNRSNDEPDPTLLPSAASTPFGNRLLMGATITVPEGSRGAPFFHSLLSNLMNTVQEINDDQNRPETPSPPANQRSSHDPTPTNPDANQARRSVLDQVLQARNNQRARLSRPDAAIEAVVQYLQGTENQFPADLQRDLPAESTPDVLAFQRQLLSLTQHLPQLGPRIQQLPAALERLQTNAEQGSQLASAVNHAIQSVQAMGDLCNAIARRARRLVARHNNQSGIPPRPRELGQLPTTPPAVTREESTNNEVSNQENPQLSRFLSSIFERINEQGSHGNNSTADEAFENRIEIEATIPVWQLLNLTSGASPAAASAQNRNQWNFGGFAHRLIADIPSVDLLGVLSGNRESLHNILQRIGIHMFEGLDLPQMSPGTNREWSMQMVASLQDYVDSLPRFSHAAIQPPSTNLLSQLVHSISPFAPELVVFFIRGTSVEPNASNGGSSSFTDNVCDFLGHMARQIYLDLLRYIDSDSSMSGVLESLFVHCSLDRSIARFLVDAFLSFPTVRDARNERSAGFDRSTDHETQEAKRRRTS